MEALCKYEECRRSPKYRGYCPMHYYSLLNSGLLPRIRRKQIRSSFERFETKFTVDDSSGCWLWTSCLNDNGYGILMNDRKKAVRASHVSYEKHKGPIPSGSMVLHRCDNPPCVNPEHLFLGNGFENMQDCVNKGRHACQNAGTSRKISDPMALNIRVMYARGYSIETLRAIYSVQYQTICDIVKGKGHL